VIERDHAIGLKKKMKCISCDSDCNNDDKFCVSCGEPLLPLSPIEKRFCIHCRAMVDLGLRFCTECEKPLDVSAEANIPVHSHSPVKPTTSHDLPKPHVRDAARMESTVLIASSPVFVPSKTGGAWRLAEAEDDDFDVDESEEEYGHDSEESDEGMVRGFYGNMKWWDPVDQPASIQDLPEEFKQAKKLWDRDASGNFDKMVQLLEPYIGARFIASNISDWEELFIEGGEIEASVVKLVGLSFEGGSLIPTCQSEARFKVRVKSKINEVNLDEWQDEHSLFTDALIFYWNIPQPRQGDWLDFGVGNHSGVECISDDDVEQSIGENKMEELIENLVTECKNAPRNKVFVPENLLIISIKEETGSEIDAENFRALIQRYENGEMGDDDESIYDGAVYVCGQVAKRCFLDDPDADDIDYDISWIENNDGSFSAEVRPS
jgi:Double zinc ribbon